MKALTEGRYILHANPIENYDEKAAFHQFGPRVIPAFSELIQGKVQDTLFQEFVGFPSFEGVEFWLMTFRLTEPLTLSHALPMTEEDSLSLHRWLWRSTWDEHGFNPVTPWRPDGEHSDFKIERYASSDSVILDLKNGSYQFVKMSLDDPSYSQGYTEEWMVFDESSFLAHYFLVHTYDFADSLVH